MDDASRTREELLEELAEARAKIAELEDRFQGVFETSPVGIVLVDVETQRILQANQAFLSIVGYDSSELVELSVAEITHPDEREYDRKQIQDRLEGESPTYTAEKRYVRKDGGVRWVHVSGDVYHLADGRRLAVANVLDITERRRTETALRRSEQRFRSYVENAGEIVYSVDSDGVFTYISPNWREFMGRPVDVALGHAFDSYVHADDVRRCRDFLQRVLSTKERQVGLEFRARRSDGQWRWLATTGSALFDESGDVVGLVGIARDITDMKLVHEELRRSEQEKVLVLNSTKEMFVYYDRSLRVQWANRAAGESVGRRPEELIGERCYRLWHERDEPCPSCPVLKARDGGQPAEEELVTPDGRHWYLRGYPVFGEADQIVGMVEFGQDITARKVAEKALRESEERFRHLFNYSPQAIALTEKGTGRFVEVNQHLCEISGYSREELIGNTTTGIGFYSAEDRQRYLDEFEAHGYVDGLEMSFITRDGSRLTALMFARSVTLNEGRFLLTMLNGEDSPPCPPAPRPS